MREIIRFILIILPVFFSVVSCQDTDVMNQEERKWLNERERIQVAVYPSYPPYIFLDKKDHPVGILMDYLKLLEKRAQFKFDIKTYDDFSNIMEDARNNNLDLILEIQEAPSRQEYLNFYFKLFESPYVIVGKKSSGKVKTIKDFETASFYLPNDFAIVENLKIQFPKATILTPCGTDLECLKKISESGEGYFVGPKAVVTYYIESKSLHNLEILKYTGKYYEPSIAVVKNDVMLNEVIYSAMQSITYQDRQEIIDSWLVTFNKPFYQRVSFWVKSCIGILCLLLLIVVFNRYLKYVINSKTSELKKAKVKAEQSSKLKTSFINNITHEIRTPMNAIMGFSDLLSREDIDKTQKEDHLIIINQACLRLMNMMDNVLELSLLQSKQLSAEKNRVILKELLIKCFEKYKNNARSKKIPYRLEIDIVDNHNFVVVDEDKLCMVIKHVIDNAIKFTSQGEVFFFATIKDDALDITVTDTGIGISNERQKSIFDSYSKSNQDETTELFEGLGLGLTISKAYIELMNGQLDVHSELGKGTTVHIHVPISIAIKQEIYVEEVKEYLKGPQPSFYKILIAEDVTLNYVVLKSILEKIKDYNLEIIRAVNGREAIEIVERELNIDLVLMDVQMPIMNGYKATLAIKKRFPHIPIVAQTAYTNSEDRQKAFASGCDGFISKPIKPDLVKKMLKKFIPN
jgi:two-component system sensor histidine kinase EvgS